MLAVFGGARPLLFAAADHQWAAGAGPCKSPGALTERTETHSTTPPGLVSCTVGCQGRARDDQEVAIALPPAQGLPYQRRQPLRSVLAATGAGWASGWESTGNRAAFAGWSRERAGGEAEPSRVDGGAWCAAGAAALGDVRELPERYRVAAGSLVPGAHADHHQ